ncbi:MAG: T9SS type A sorting domain-containing protein [Lishizhenia sp.]
MKKTFTLGLGLLLFTSAISQTFSDNFDTYVGGTYIGVTSDWTTWSGAGGGADDLIIAQGPGANSPNNYLYFLGQGQGGPSDIVKPFQGEQNVGQFDLSLMLNVETGKNAYFNLQRNATIGQVWALDFNFKDDETFELNNQTDGVLLTGSYTQGTYFEMNIQADFNTNTWEFFIDGVSQGSFSNSNNQIASMNFYPIQNSAFSVDDFEYTITPYTLQPVNLSLLQIDVNGTLAGQTKAPNLKLRNLGMDVITSFEVEVEYNGSITTESVTGLNLMSLENYELELSQMITLVAGNNPVTATITSVNGNGLDNDQSDDVKIINIDPVVPAEGKIVVGEEGTGTWCAWCPRGAVFMDIMALKFEGLWAGIAVHNGDPMANSTYDSGIGALISGYPSSLVDRGQDINPAYMESDFLQRIVIEPTATLKPGVIFHPSNRWLEVSMTAKFVSAADNGYKMAIVLTEDSVTGTGSGYDQVNAYSNNIDLFDPAGFNWSDLPSVVPAADMKYDHVARGIFPSFDGVALFPAVVNAGDEHTLNTYMTVPAGWDVEKMHIIGLLIDPQGRIDNAGYASFNDALENGFVLGSDEVEAELINPVFSMYPNPTTNNTTISISNVGSQNVTITLFDFAGNKISTKDLGIVNGNSATVLNTEHLSKGIYAVELTVGNNTEVKKLVVQ